MAGAVAYRLDEDWLELTEDDLPYDDGEPMETEWHRKDMALLIETLQRFLAWRNDVFVGGNMGVYFMREQTTGMEVRGPDFMVVLGAVERSRKSWVVWQEGKPPDLVIELISTKTRSFDKGAKKRLYQDRLELPEYYWYDPISHELAGFERVHGVYRRLEPDGRGRLVSPVLGLALVEWTGTYEKMTTRWLRWETLDGELLPTGDELAAAERRRADEMSRRADQESQRADEMSRKADRLAARLRELGIDPNE